MSGITEAEIFGRITPLFRDVFGQADLVVTRDLTAISVRGWDSLAHVTLVSTVEEEFGVHFALGELQDLQNVGDMIDLLLKKLAAD